VVNKNMLSDYSEEKKSLPLSRYA